MHSPELAECLQVYSAGNKPEKAIERKAVKAVLAQLLAVAPGHSVELRIPPYSAIQIVDGPRHKRGTPGAVVETSAEVLLRLAAGDLTWEQATASGKLIASGERSNLSGLFPLELCP